MNVVIGFRATILASAFALGGCGSLLNPRPPAEPELTLTEQRERSQPKDGVTTDADPAPLSAFSWSAPPATPPPPATAEPRSAKRP